MASAREQQLPAALRVALYPACWLYHTAAGDALHCALHRCSEWGEHKQGVGARLARLLGYIHTCHHRYLDAFGTVDTRFQWHNLVLSLSLAVSLSPCLCLSLCLSVFLSLCLSVSLSLSFIL